MMPAGEASCEDNGTRSSLFSKQGTIYSGRHMSCLYAAMGTLPIQHSVMHETETGLEQTRLRSPLPLSPSVVTTQSVSTRVVSAKGEEQAGGGKLKGLTCMG